MIWTALNTCGYNKTGSKNKLRKKSETKEELCLDWRGKMFPCFFMASEKKICIVD